MTTPITADFLKIPSAQYRRNADLAGEAYVVEQSGQRVVIQWTPPEPPPIDKSQFDADHVFEAQLAAKVLRDLGYYQQTPGVNWVGYRQILNGVDNMRYLSKTINIEKGKAITAFLNTTPVRMHDGLRWYVRTTESIMMAIARRLDTFMGIPSANPNSHASVAARFYLFVIEE